MTPRLRHLVTLCYLASAGDLVGRDAPSRRRAAVLVALVTLCYLAPSAASAPVDPDVIQARYDAARDREEALLRSRTADRRALRSVWTEIRWAERADARPRGWRGARGVPRAILPASARHARAPRASDRRLTRRLARLGRSFDGWAALWVHDLRTGRTAGWNADARFPAASTVKLAVLAAALHRWSRRPEWSAVWYDLRQVAGWSSNVGANRVLAQLGGLGPVYAAMRRLGMRSSTYVGAYRAGTSRGGGESPPPQTHTRVTTARDLGRALYAFHAAAHGNRYVQHRSGLTARNARLGLALLLSAHPRGNNAGLLRPFLRRTPVAQKVGWLSDARLTAAIVYGRRGPKIVVVLTYRPNLAVDDSLALGRRVVHAVRP